MSRANRVILWDFDGTLVYQVGAWPGTLVEVLDEHEPNHGITLHQIRPFLRDGFPWHRPSVPHPELSTPAAWWKALNPLFVRAYEGVGIMSHRAMALARLVREHYLDVTRFRLFEDTRDTLIKLDSSGWKHTILSNHVPELAQIVEGIGLGDLISHVVNSAVIGFEKPHPEAFQIALRTSGDPTRVWMVGDNPEADALGAEAVGIPAILVRREDVRVARRVADLHAAARLIDSTDKENENH
ncbi:HAD family hydrolase [Candidatus Poribacteria bacterium]|nr:HAD family hydrolase [Candidatus Poribacteria bacterium]